MAMLAVCPGSFDPVTLGHLDVFRTAAALFDRVQVVVVHNPEKTGGLLDASGRVELLRLALDAAGIGNADAELFSGRLLADYCREVGADAIVKGVRGARDLDDELPMSAVNRDLAGIPTVFVPTLPAHSHISSSLVRQVIDLGGDCSPYVPAVVAPLLAQRPPRGRDRDSL